MSLFPRFTQEFSPLFRLIDDYDRASRHVFRQMDTPIRSFSPKFDVKETKDTYELHGEFPGIEQKDINIEWTDANTLQVSGRTESVKEEGQKPQDFIEQGEMKDKSPQSAVEDEGNDSTVATTNANQEVAKREDAAPRYWVSERNVGEFHRSFSFPARVDQDAVKASLKDGILSVVVPKAVAPKPRKIIIE